MALDEYKNVLRSGQKAPRTVSILTKTSIYIFMDKETSIIWLRASTTAHPVTVCEFTVIAPGQG